MTRRVKLTECFESAMQVLAVSGDPEVPALATKRTEMMLPREKGRNREFSNEHRLKDACLFKWDSAHNWSK